MIAANTEHQNGIKISKKRSSTGAAVNLKKILKVVKRIFTQTKPATMAIDQIASSHTSLTEEEIQNWLNEQIAAEESKSD